MKIEFFGWTEEEEENLKESGKFVDFEQALFHAIDLAIEWNTPVDVVGSKKKQKFLLATIFPDDFSQYD